jgi:hypothetical protein
MVSETGLRRFPRDRPAERYDDVYWLGRCHGFEVEMEGRELGVVSEVRYASRADVPDLIVVRAGRLRHQLLLIPIELVARIDSEGGRLELIEGATAAQTSRRRPKARRPLKPIAAGTPR